MRHFGGFFTFRVRRQITISVGRSSPTGRPWRAQRAIFFEILMFLHLKTQIFLWSPWPLGQSWDILSSFGAKSLPIFLMIGILNGESRVYAPAWVACIIRYEVSVREATSVRAAVPRVRSRPAP